MDWGTIWTAYIAFFIAVFILVVRHQADEEKYKEDNKPSESPESEWPEIYVWKDKEPWE